MEKRIKYLFDQYQVSKLTTAESQEFLGLIADENESVSEELLSMILQADEAKHRDVVISQRGESLLAEILASDKPNKTKVRRLFPFKWVAAAVVLIAISVVLYVRKGATTPNYTVFTQDVKPGINKAVLTLADGKEVSLSDIKNGEISKQAGLSITKTEEGKLIYKVLDDVKAEASLKFNTISTPKGGQWQVLLPDGSKVWLNAVSSLTYPLSFASSKNRKVELSGEAYFEIAKDKLKPFIVQTAKQDVEVLGTHFNITSYADDQVTKTTLLEGSVKVKDNRSGDAQMLKPGEQCSLSESGIAITNIDVDESIAWKNGYFMFHDERQDAIMRKLARWYNVEVEYLDPSVKDIKFFGTVSRFGNLSQVLRKLEQTSKVRFDIKGNKIIVRKEN